MALADILELDAFREGLAYDPEFTIAVRHWTGIEPDRDVMRTAANAALRI